MPGAWARCSGTGRRDRDRRAGPVSPGGERQLALPLLAAPLVVKGHGLRAGHVRPHVARIRDKGRRAGQMWSGRVPCTHAWAYQWVNVQDAGATWATQAPAPVGSLAFVQQNL